MSIEAVLLILVLLVQVGFLAILLLRRPPTDPGITACQSGLERQGERLGELAAELRAMPDRVEAKLGPVVQGFAAEQTKLLRDEGRAAREEQGAKLAELTRATGDLKDQLTRANEELRAQVNAALTTLQTQLLDRLAAEAKESREAAAREAERSRTLLDAKLKEVQETSEKRLAEIQKSVNEQLAEAVEKRMNESFTRVIDQFNAIQNMMGNVQSVASQVGDLKRLFGNVKTRGGWGEAQLKAMLDDFLPEGAYETNVKLREDAQDVVEFAILMPGSGEARARLPLDAKFPAEDYERLIAAHDAGDPAEEARARKALENRVRLEAAKIAEKYICPPRSTDYAILYLPTEGLWAEVARMPGLIEDVGRTCRVFIAGPSLLPAMLKTIHLGYVQVALSQNALGVRDLLSATKEEMAKMEAVLGQLSRQVGTVSNTIGRAQTRTRQIARKLKSVELLPGGQGEKLLELDSEPSEEEAEAEEA
ncbi:MAG: DNA recombination protein RmuC [Acetobacteraceae bacterium]|nr:DNA recombination protein RmuC [Acetobacteraceae bacterium]